MERLQRTLVDALTRYMTAPRGSMEERRQLARLKRLTAREVNPHHNPIA